MANHFDHKTNKKEGRTSQLERLEETGLKEGLELEKKLYKQIKQQIIHDTKKKRKPSEKIKSNTFRFRLTDSELAKLEAFADKKECSAAQVLREYIHRLPALDETASENASSQY